MRCENFDTWRFACRPTTIATRMRRSLNSKLSSAETCGSTCPCRIGPSVTVVAFRACSPARQSHKGIARKEIKHTAIHAHGKHANGKYAHWNHAHGNHAANTRTANTHTESRGRENHAHNNTSRARNSHARKITRTHTEITRTTNNTSGIQITQAYPVSATGAGRIWRAGH
jgi:hypothetical protein